MISGLDDCFVSYDLHVPFAISRYAAIAVKLAEPGGMFEVPHAWFMTEMIEQGKNGPMIFY